MRKKNLLNQRFGKLLVIGEAPSSSDGRARWICQCDCGELITTYGKLLLSGSTKSCGCYFTEMLTQTKLHDLSGKQFGNWTVLKRQDDGYYRVRWLCRCACGTITTVIGSNLTKGLSRSCGHCHTSKPTKSGPNKSHNKTKSK